MNKQLLIIFGLLIVIAGCGQAPRFKYDQPEIPRQYGYEKVWVNPQIVYSDSLYSLIKAERIDSIYTENSENNFTDRSITFHIPMSSCFTKINLLNSNSEILASLFASDLNMGYYKMNYNPHILDTSYTNHNKQIFIRISYCARTVLQQLEL